MITKENKISKICSFYASDFHLEMIMLPYINKKIDEEADIVIMTERNLEETMEIVVSRINLPEKRKQEILNINWENNDCKKIKNIRNTNKEKEIVVFIVGDKNYIKNIHTNIDNVIKDYNNAKIIDCYALAEVQEEMVDIVAEHSKVLNTIEEKNI